MSKKILALIFAFVIALNITSCKDNGGEFTINEGVSVSLDGKNITETTKTQGKKTTIRKKNIKVRFEMEDGGEFIMELYPEYAPETVLNFLELVNSSFYDGLTFHRVIPGFMAQGGDPEGTGMGGSDTKIKGEFASNGFEDNTLPHERGTVSMARSMDKDSASSQFFICFDEAPHLDGDYAAFGKVVYGMETVDEMAEAAVDENDKPLVDIVIKKATIISDAQYKEYGNK